MPQTDARFFRRAAFTLIELLVVISIIALLVAMILPALAKAKQAAIRARCAGNLHQISICYTTYSNDFRSWLPYNETVCVNDMFWISIGLRDTFKKSYGMPQAIFDCPATTGFPTTKFAGASYSWSIPQPNSGMPIVPTGYLIYAGRVAGYGLTGALSVPLTSIPFKVDDRNMMKSGQTVTPWMLCYADWSPGEVWTPNEYYGDQPMHFREGVNVMQADASLLFKKYPGSNITDVNADPSTLKFFIYTPYGYQLPY